MIKVRRVIIIGEVSISNAEIYDHKEQHRMGIPQVFEELQILVTDTLGRRYITNQRMVHLIELRRYQGPKSEFTKIKRISMTYQQITFAPAWIIPNHLYKKYGVPQIYNSPNYKELYQCTWVADGLMYMTGDDLITTLEL